MRRLMSGYRSLPLGVALAALLAAQPASAQAPDESVAQEKFIEGREALKAGRFERARELFVQSQALHPSTGTLLNLAFTEEKMGKVASASKHFSALADKLAPNDDRGPLVQEHLAALTPRVPHLRITVNGTLPVGARVALDDVVLERDQLAVEQAVDPGPHVIIVTAHGRVGKRFEIDAVEGKHGTVSVEVGEPLPPPVVTPGPVPVRAPEPPPTPVNARRVAGITIGAIGVAGLAAAGAIGGVTLSKKHELEGLCPDPSACTPKGVQMADSAHSLSMAGTVVFGAGLAMAGVGVVLIATSSTPKKSSASITFAPAPGGGSLAFRGAF